MWNIWFLSPLVPSKGEKNILNKKILFVSVCISFKGSMFTFKFLNDKIHNYYLHLYIFLSFWGNERRQKPNIPDQGLKQRFFTTLKTDCHLLLQKVRQRISVITVSQRVSPQTQKSVTSLPNTSHRSWQ